MMQIQIVVLHLGKKEKSFLANMLPLHAQKVAHRWCFTLDEDSPLLQLKDGFSLEVEIVSSEHEEVAQKLLDEFNCVPTFLPNDLQKKFYHGFCKQQLWPIFHYMLPMCPEHGDRFALIDVLAGVAFYISGVFFWLQDPLVSVPNVVVMTSPNHVDGR